VKLRYWVGGGLGLSLALFGPGHTYRLALLAVSLALPVRLIYVAATKGPTLPDNQERYLLQMQGIDPDQLPDNWRELVQCQWELVQAAFEQAARLRFPGQQGRQARFVGSCWMRWDLRRLDINRAQAAENNIRQLEIR
jgi:hypothetical protein